MGESLDLFLIVNMILVVCYLMPEVCCATEIMSVWADFCVFILLPGYRNCTVSSKLTLMYSF